MERRDTDRLIRAAERLADSNEAIVELAKQDPELEVEAGPAICPSCGAVDPSIRVTATEEEVGPLSQFFVRGMCRSCGEPIYAIPEGWQSVSSTEEARIVLLARKAGTDEH